MTLLDALVAHLRSYALIVLMVAAIFVGAVLLFRDDTKLCGIFTISKKERAWVRGGGRLYYFELEGETNSRVSIPYEVYDAFFMRQKIYIELTRRMNVFLYAESAESFLARDDLP